MIIKAMLYVQVWLFFWFLNQTSFVVNTTIT